MNAHHKAILQDVEESADDNPDQWVNQSYHGNNHRYYGLKVRQKRKIAKNWIRENKDISQEDLIKLLDSLLEGESYEEKTIAAEIIHHLPQHKAKISTEKLDEWLDKIEGWAEIDALCYGFVDKKNIQNYWRRWRVFITQLARSKSMTKRRASAVLLVKPVKTITDERIMVFSFRLIDQLSWEKDRLISKAISWLLRSMIVQFKTEVAEYIKQNQDTLPPIALRETRKKLLTGKKK